MDRHRFYAIDHLRTSMMFVVMFGHPLLPYLTVPRSFKDPSTHIGFDVVAVFLYSFAMQAFFVTPGFAAALVLAKKGHVGLWQNRFKRIFMPLLLAYILITPLMRAAYDFAKAVVKFDSIDAGWAALLTGEWIRWSKLYHLWFLASLILFTALALLCIWLFKRLKLDEYLSNWLSPYLLGFRGIALLTLLVSLTTIPAYIFDTGSGTHWSMQITLFAYFALGWFLYKQQNVIQSWQVRWRPPLVTALIALPVCVWASRARLFDENNIDLIMGLLAGITNGVLGMCMTVALIGWCHLKLNKPSKIGEGLGQASYWVYLIHFPIVVFAGGIVAVFDTPALFKYFATLALAIPLIALSYFTLVLGTPLRHIIIGKKRDKH